MKANHKSPITTNFLAKLCGVSQGTVDRALHDRPGISTETKEHILSIAKEYGYRPNLHARNLVNGKSGIIGMVVFDLYNDYFSEMIMNLESAFCSAGLFPLVMFSEKDRNRELECIQTLYSTGIDGLIICPVGCGETFEKYLTSLNIPVVTVGNRIPGTPYVGVDNFQAMYELAEHRIRQGFQKLVYFAPVLRDTQNNTDAQQQRYQGFLSAARKHGIPFDVVIHPPQQLEQLCPNDSTAIIASTDYYALRLIYAGIPAKQVSGFDRIKAIDSYRIPLLTVDSGSQQTAQAIVSMFTEDPSPIDRVIPHRIVMP